MISPQTLKIPAGPAPVLLHFSAKLKNSFLLSDEPMLPKSNSGVSGIESLTKSLELPQPLPLGL